MTGYANINKYFRIVKVNDLLKIVEQDEDFFDPLMWLAACEMLTEEDQGRTTEFSVNNLIGSEL